MASLNQVRRVITPWRTLYTVALLAAVLLAIVGFQSSKDENRSAVCQVAPVIQQLYPCPGDTDLRQGIIGAALQSGYQAVLIVDSTEIPQDEIRTGGANQVYFQPGPGTETGALAPGQHSATVVYWPVNGTRASDSKSYRWVFGVT